MAKKGVEYERELRKILSGEKETIEKISKRLGEKEAKNYSLLLKNPFLVVRAAGSFGVDLIAMRQDFSFPIEVKVSSQKKLIFSHSSGRAQKQYEEFMRLCKKAGVMLLYAYRLKGVREDPWRIFAIDVEPKRGSLKLVYKFLPKMQPSSKGNIVLNWENGKPLNEFVAYIVHLLK